jgi:cell wall-associated NlpC family hydrolase
MQTKKIIAYAAQFVGIQFKKNASRRNIDCSSFVQMVYKKNCITLPRTAILQSQVGIYVPREELQPCDLLFFYVPDKYATNDIVGHVGIYAGKQKMIHCIPTSNIFLTSINKPHWNKTFLMARRVINEKQVMNEVRTKCDF